MKNNFLLFCLTRQHFPSKNNDMD